MDQRVVKIKQVVVAVAFLLLLPFSLEAKKPIKSVVITGQNNHHWELSHILLKDILENSALFSVDIAMSPKKGEDMSQFGVDFDQYDLVVLDYNGDSWSTQMQQQFVDYVKGGGGVVFYHASNNSFPNWVEYNEMAALGGWNGRTERSGPWVYVENGEIVKDYSEGRGGAHGKSHDFVMKCYNDKHPITKGLPKEWLQGGDELYGLMRGPGNIKDLLYTAYSNKEGGGSGREEPLIYTVEYGRGRIFHTMLGHCGKSAENNTPMQSSGFQITLLRGAEWAATGKVKQPLPKDMSTKEECKLRKEYK